MRGKIRSWLLGECVVGFSHMFWCYRGAGIREKLWLFECMKQPHSRIYILCVKKNEYWVSTVSGEVLSLADLLE